MSKNYLLLVAMLGLTACGGSSTEFVQDMDFDDQDDDDLDDDDDMGNMTTAASFQTLVDSNLALDLAGPGTVTPVETLESASSAASGATYTGYINFFDEDDDRRTLERDIAGTLTLEIDFSSSDDALTGTVSDLTRRDGVTFDGDLELSSPNVFTNDDGGALFADIIGRATDTEGNLADFDASLNSTKAFGDGAEQIRGGVGGTIDYLGEEDYTSGNYTVER